MIALWDYVLRLNDPFAYTRGTVFAGDYRGMPTGNLGIFMVTDYQTGGVLHREAVDLIGNLAHWREDHHEEYTARLSLLTQFPDTRKLMAAAEFDAWFDLFDLQT